MPKYHTVNGRLGRILIVDDEPEVRKPIVLSLLDARYEVVEANNGEQAIEALKAEGNALMVDTILCDTRCRKSTASKPCRRIFGRIILRSPSWC